MREENMFVRKSKISHLIKKEKAKERDKCRTIAEAELKETLKQLKKEYNQQMKELTKNHKSELKEKEKEVSQLKQEIEKNYYKYQQLRRREKELDNLSADLENMLNSMGIKIQESIQPFYRTRAKIETTKRSSDKKHTKVQSIFRAVQ
jgi:hypothetical protein